MNKYKTPEVWGDELIEQLINCIVPPPPKFNFNSGQQITWIRTGEEGKKEAEELVQGWIEKLREEYHE